VLQATRRDAHVPWLRNTPDPKYTDVPLPVLAGLGALLAAVIAVAGVIAIRSARQADATPEHRAELVNAFLRVLTGEARHDKTAQ
jgi:hypothetical protein